MNRLPALLLPALPVVLLATAAPLRAGTVVQFRTALGDVKVELLDAEKPVTTSNFLHYVTTGAYRDMFCHRAVHDFVLQGGGFSLSGRGTAAPTVVPVVQAAAITNEFGVGPKLSNTAGTIAMAKTSDPNSATSQFFFNLKDNTSLDDPKNSGGFTVFGRVVSGLQTLTNWNSFLGLPAGPIDFSKTNLIVNAGGVPFNELPVYRLGTNSAGGAVIDVSQLVFMDVTLLDVHVARREDGTAEVRWSPLLNRTNTVEFTTVFPPQWQTLTNVPPERLGNGVVVDPTPDPARFYRVRATY